jgi:P27 family predicted phage terminase small subunit
MARPRQPINLLEAKGKKHLTKAEIEERRSTEVTASDDNIVAPEYLTAKQKREFDKIAKQLVDIKIMANLDCDALARFIIAKDQYVKFTKIVRKIPDDWKLINSLDKATLIQDRAFKQCRAAASDLGLTITSRCKLIIPKKEEKQESKWDKFRTDTG